MSAGVAAVAAVTLRHTAVASIGRREDSAIDWRLPATRCIDLLLECDATHGLHSCQEQRIIHRRKIRQPVHATRLTMQPGARYNAKALILS